MRDPSVEGDRRVALQENGKQIPEVTVVMDRLHSMFTQVSPEELSGIEQKRLRNYRTRFERQMQSSSDVFEVYEQHVAVLSPQGDLEDYYSSRENGKKLVLVDSANGTSFKNLFTDTLLTCGGIGITIGTKETGEWKILAHAYDGPTFFNALLAIGVTRALEQGANPQETFQIKFDTAGSPDIHRERITDFISRIGLRAEIVFEDTRTPNRKYDRELII